MKALAAILSLAGLAAANNAGCSAADRAPPLDRTGRRAPPAPPFESPARWASYPEAVGAPTSTLVLGAGRCLVLTDDGQRWLVESTDPKTPCAGRGTASGSPSLEPLVFAEKIDGAFRFVGEGGVVYTAREPTGPFERAVRAPTFLTRVAAGGATVVGVDRAGKTFHFADGGWRPSTVPGSAFGVDVAVDPAGRALWLGAPESVLVSGDGGRSFAAVGGVPTNIGPWQATLLDGARLGLLGVTGSVVLEGDRVVRSPARPASGPPAPAQIEPVRGPKESLIRSGVAALSGKTYFEVVERTEGSPRWGLLRVELGGASETLPLAGRDACEAIRVAAQSGAVALACIAPSDGESDLALELSLSIDGGKTFSSMTKLSAQTFGDVHLALAPNRTMLVTGACRAATKGREPPPPASSAKPKRRGRPDDSGSGCAPKAPVIVRPQGDGVSVVEGSGSQIEQGSARSPALSLDGRFAYVLARTRREGRLALFLSRDGGRSYTERRLELVGSGWDDEEDAAPAEADRMLSIPERAIITVDEAGSLGLSCDGSAGPVWVTLDSDGRVQSAGQAPEPGAQLGGFGARVLAIGFADDEVLRAWESLDGASSFTEIAVTQAVQRFAAQGEWSMACSSGGCVLGDDLVRVGWEGQAELPFEIAEETFTGPDLSLTTPIACRLTPRTDWTTIGGADEDGGAGPRLPRLRDVARGKTAWSVVSVEPSGKVVVASASMPERGPDPKDKSPGTAAVAFKQLLAAPATKDTAVVVRPQAEGYVAMRAVVPRTKTGGVDESATVDKIELAWQNQYLGLTAKRSVRLDEKWSRLLVAPGPAPRLRPALLSIAAGGVTVRATSKRATFFDAQSGATAFDYPVWDEVLTDNRDLATGDAALFGMTPGAVAFVDRSPAAQVFAYGRAPAKGAAMEIVAVTVGPGHADLEWIAAGDRSGLAAVTVLAGAPERAEAWLLDERGVAREPIALPRLSGAPDPLAPCSSEQRRNTPRSVSAHFTRSGALAGTAGRRAVLVTDSPTSAAGSLGAPVQEPIWLLTDGAILHGTPAAPCLGAWKASGVRNGAVGVITGDLDHAWLIRESFQAEGRAARPSSGRGPASAAPPRAVRVLQARPMTCKADAALAVPQEVAARAGHRLPDDQP